MSERAPGRTISARRPSLGPFRTELRERLDALSAADLVGVLVSHAQRLPAAERRAFLAIFPEPGREAPGPDQQQELLARIAAFSDRLARGEYADADGEDWDGDWDRFSGRQWPEEEPVGAWVADADDLFAAAGEVFLTGSAADARRAYEALLPLFGSWHRPRGVGSSGSQVDAEPVDGPQTDAGTLEIWELQATDVAEMLVRYLRTVYEVTDPDQRATGVWQAWMSLPWCPQPPSLAQVAGTRPEPLTGLQSFLPGWIDRLLDSSDWPPVRDRVRLLVEAADLGHGIDTLTDLAGRPGPHRGGISLALVDALSAADRAGEAAGAATRALALTGLEAGVRATLADRLAALARRLGDQHGAVAARRSAWRCLPTRARLLALVTDSQAAGLLEQTLAGLADTLGPAGTPSTLGRFGCELLLLRPPGPGRHGPAQRGPTRLVQAHPSRSGCPALRVASSDWHATS